MNAMLHIHSQLSAQDIGLVLQTAGLHPFVKNVNLYGIQNGGDDYEVFTGQLPEVYIRKLVPMDYFDFREKPWILAAAMNRINNQYSPVRVTAANDIISLTLCIEPGSFESFSERLPQWLSYIEQAVDQLGQACEVIIREDEEDDLSRVNKQLSDPTPDSPWLRGQKLS